MSIKARIHGLDVVFTMETEEDVRMFRKVFEGLGRTPLGQTLGQRIRELRRALHMTQADLAYHIGISMATVGSWENSKSRPSPVCMDKLNEIAAAHNLIL